MFIVDLNCDMGESFGAYKMGMDEEILDFVTSANIACGFHAGDPTTIRKTVQLAIEKNVGIGVHPGFQDLLGFGRRDIQVSPQEAYDLIVYQIGAIYGFAKSEGGKIQHVKPHGALYNMAAKNALLAEAIAEAVYKVDPELILFGLAGGELIQAGKNIGLRTASEVFSDRSYQVIRMVKEGKVNSVQGADVTIQADTVCIHGDGENALDFAKYISKALKEENIHVAKISEFLK